MIYMQFVEPQYFEIYKNFSGSNNFWDSYCCVSIITLCCCFAPLGFFSVIYSYRSLKNYRNGQHGYGKKNAEGKIVNMSVMIQLSINVLIV